MSVASDSPSKVDSDEMKEKLFVCTSPGCNQKFQNADSLSVHKQKHQMTLTLGPSKLTSIADVLPVDQTPTPTRFLHLGNQLGLFDELNLNPFDREFKTAQKDGMSTKQRRAAAVVQHIQALSQKNKSPSTPTRAATTSSDGTTYSVPGQTGYMIAITPTLSSPVTGFSGNSGQFLVPPMLPSPQGLIPTLPGYNASSPLSVPVNLLSPTLMPFPSGFIPAMSPSLMADAQRAAFTHAMFAAAASASSPLTTNNAFSTLPSSQSLDNPATFSNTSATNNNTYSSIDQPDPLPVPSLVIPKQERPMSRSSVSSAPHKFPEQPSVMDHSLSDLRADSVESFSQGSSQNIPSSYPVVVQLPNGETTCVGLSSNAATMPTGSLITASSALPSVSSLQHPVMTSAASHPSLESRPSSEFGSNSNLFEAKQKLKETLKTNNPGLQNTLANQTYVTTSDTETKPARRRGRQSQDIDPDIKRQRFLERNRAAASRCRSKKKVWVNGLEARAKTLAQTNVLLQNEIAALKDEVASLKQLLLSHRDCPVTKLQQQSMAMAGINLDLSSSSSLSTLKPESRNNSGHHATLSSTLSSNSVEENLRTSTRQSNSPGSLANGSLYLAMSSSATS